MLHHGEFSGPFVSLGEQGEYGFQAKMTNTRLKPETASVIT